MQLDLAPLYALVEQGYLTCRPHPDPEVDLLIWNYTPKAMYDQYWTPETRMCRGLVTTSGGEIVARGFPKFFNLEEHINHNWPVPFNEPVTVTEKVDGSLILVFLYQGELQVASRGSFISEQARWAREILERKYQDFSFSVHYTYLFEVVYPSNRIVVDYGEMEDLVLLATIYTKTGDEHSIYEPLWPTQWPFPITTCCYVGALQKWEPQEIENFEGYVVRFESGLRVKIKLAEYKRVHAIITRTSSKTIWKCLKEGISLAEVLDRVPSDFQAWVKQLSKELSQEYQRLYVQSKARYKEIVESAYIHIPWVYEQDTLDYEELEKINRAMKKKVTEQFKQYPDLEHFLHLLYSGAGRGNQKKEFSDAIWDSIQPKYARPFMIDGEEKSISTQEEPRKELQPV